MAKREIKDYPLISFDSDGIEGFIDFDGIFARRLPLHIEIGSGKGTFLVNQASVQTEINFFGIEWANKYYKHAVDRIGRWQLTNVRITRADAAELIAANIAEDSVDCFHIYFPDPWPKSRHHKRRMVCEKNSEQMLRCLKSGGIINIATDHDEYYQWMREVFAGFIAAGRVVEIDFIKPIGAEAEEMAGTNFERKYLKEGRITNTIAVKKV
ncbi:MAG: tRNA (guanosine(46)-N7)-methyltransferase TrmB [Anaerohalosphaeraceae bacterium]|nr:tRNA (guanosine(46)-N7)-methyltransferase TrmB [Anaerohalosphaeraceae bacterium]